MIFERIKVYISFQHKNLNVKLIVWWMLYWFEGLTFIKRKGIRHKQKFVGEIFCKNWYYKRKENFLRENVVYLKKLLKFRLLLDKVVLDSFQCLITT